MLKSHDSLPQTNTIDLAALQQISATVHHVENTVSFHLCLIRSTQLTINAVEASKRVRSSRSNKQKVRPPFFLTCNDWCILTSPSAHGVGADNAPGHTEGKTIDKNPGMANVASDSGSTNVGIDNAGANQPGEKVLLE